MDGIRIKCGWCASIAENGTHVNCEYAREIKRDSELALIV